MNFKNYLEKLRALPDKQKVIILWTTVIILGALLIYFWINLTVKRLDEISKSVKIPEVQIPQTQLPPVLSPDQTAGWKTYTNQEFGFGINYPKDWYLKDLTKNRLALEVYLSPIQPDKSDNGGMEFINGSLTVNSIESKQTLLDFSKEYLHLDAAKSFETEKVKIGGLDGLKIVPSCEGVGCGRPYWFVKKDSTIYIFSVGLSNNVNVMEGIISTFKLLE